VLALLVQLRQDCENQPDGSSLHLFQNDFRPTPLAKLSDFVEVDNPDYAQFRPLYAWNNFREVARGLWCASSIDAATFEETGTAGPWTAYGSYLTDYNGVRLLGWTRFDAPVTLVKNLDGIAMVSQYFFGPDIGYWRQ